jgi:two-component system sensor histidine kinase/response regulator
VVNQHFATKLLQKWGHAVTVVENGAEAVRAVEREPFDVVLMDVQMPEMSGLEATEAIRRRERERATGHLPIIALTAHAMPQDETRCLEAGMDGYISKPLRPQELFGIVERLAGSRPAA